MIRDYSEHQDSLVDHDAEIDAANDTYDEMYRLECEEANKRIEAAKISTFEKFRNRVINGIDNFFTNIN